MTQEINPTEIDPRIYGLYDEYCHGAMDRREFLAKAGATVVGGLAMAQALFPRYADAQTDYVTHPPYQARPGPRQRGVPMGIPARRRRGNAAPTIGKQNIVATTIALQQKRSDTDKVFVIRATHASTHI